MTKKLKIRDLNKPGPATIYIGPERYFVLDKCARDLSNKKNLDVKISHLVQFIIDEFSERAIVEFEAKLDQQKLG
ncbi:hypothetical protein [Rahnella sp. ChDrAdgB13]|uniref:hypothetical protein n=1 Tax=Rahnella sp. ChDrAdgB13 TaxID=1850581 RepID=UPI001AD893B5|nr:hypothetical protein [Rahnella sp. ChDrAdgB13]